MTTTSVEKTAACRSCGDPDPEALTPEMVRCRRCRLVSSVHPYEPRVYEEWSKVREWGRRAGTDVARRLSMFRLGLVAVHLRRGSRILDVGCGTGDFVACAVGAGYEAVGFDPSGRMRMLATRNLVENHGLPPGLVREQLPLGEWDAVTLWDVLEHVAMPRDFLQPLVVKLPAGGVLAVVTPDVSAVEAAAIAQWRHYKPREHLVLFDPGTLRELLTSCGLRVVSQGWDESWIRPDQDRQNLMHMVARKEA